MRGRGRQQYINRAYLERHITVILSIYWLLVLSQNKMRRWGEASHSATPADNLGTDYGAWEPTAVPGKLEDTHL